MTPAKAHFYSSHQRNLQTILRHALRLAERAGEEQDATRRAELIYECMQCWRVAQRLKRWPSLAGRA